MSEVQTREFIYMDIERVRSLYAQMEEGVVETATTESGAEQKLSGDVSGGIPGVLKGRSSGSAQRSQRSSQTITMHDHMFNIVETKLSEASNFVDLASVYSSKNWSRTEFASNTPSTAFIKVKGATRLNDFQQMETILADFHELMDAATSMQLADSNLTSKQKAEMRRKSKQDLPAKDVLKKLSRLIHLLYGESLMLKIWPFDGVSDCVFTSLLNKDCLRDPISDLTFKYGPAPQEAWTCIGRLAKITQQAETLKPRKIAGQEDLPRAIEDVFDALRGVFNFGTVKFPEISMTPLAVYRD